MKRTRETVVPFAKLKKKFQARRLENVLLHHIHVDEMKKSLAISLFEHDDKEKIIKIF